MVNLILDPYDNAKSINLWEARELLRAGNSEPPHIDVIRRWGTRGRTVRGRVVTLPTVKLGRERRTMPGWVEWFLRECIRAETPPVRPHMRSEKSRLSAHRRADARLRAAGM